MNCDNNHRNEEFIVTFDKGNKQDNSRRKHDNFPIEVESSVEQETHCITNNKSASGIVTHDYDADYIVVVVKLCVLVAVMTYNKHFCKLIPDQVQAC
ncbi:TPA: hypothetical protein ACHGAM_001768 [Escherichia coli]